MPDEHTNDPGKRMRRLLGGSKPSPMTKLPKKGDLTISSPDQHEETKGPQDRSNLTGPQSPPKPPPPSGHFGFNFGPPFWTIASVISLFVNVVLVVVLLGLLIGLSRSGLKISNMTGLGSGFLGGLYTNFEKMDRAHITADVKVETTIPVKFDLQLNQQTDVILSQDVTINNALVTVNTGGLNITRATTTIVLPQGTTLPILLNLTVPVDTTLPVTLNVPVDIPMDQTQLHEPFTGLQNVVQPFYCLLSPFAENLDGRSICN